MPPQTVTAKNIAALIAGGGVFTRADIARQFGRKKTTHVINQIELAVTLGWIKRYIGNDGTRDAYFYTCEEELF